MAPAFPLLFAAREVVRRSSARARVRVWLLEWSACVDLLRAQVCCDADDGQGRGGEGDFFGRSRGRGGRQRGGRQETIVSARTRASAISGARVS
jgi:hypothetical protein